MSRRPGRRMGRAPTGRSDPILRMRDGAHTRASEASYWDGSMLQWAPSGEQRFESGMYLGEGSATNELLRSEDFGTTWSANATTIAADQAAAPDGDVDADKIEMTTNGSAFVRQSVTNATFADSTNVTGSVWLKGLVGGEDVDLAIRDKAGDFTTGRVTVIVTTEWVRYDITKSTATGAGAVFLEIRTGDTAAKTFYAWGAQLELGDTPTSYIRTTSATVTRSADLLTFTAAQVPERIRSGRWYVDVRPNWSESESGENRYVLNNAGNNYLNFHNIFKKFRRFDGIGGHNIDSNAVTFGRGQAMRVTYDHGGPTTGVVGALTGDGVGPVGTANAWPEATLYVGSAVAGTGPWNGLIGDIYAA